MRCVFGILFGMALLIGCPPPDPANPSQGSIAPESVEIEYIVHGCPYFSKND